MSCGKDRDIILGTSIKNCILEGENRSWRWNCLLLFVAWPDSNKLYKVGIRWCICLMRFTRQDNEESFVYSLDGRDDGDTLLDSLGLGCCGL